jgi:PAS domain S-box-containing protein/putative nucleotidyltransferase with HDIG domain
METEHQELIALLEVNNELSRVESLDQLCRRAVELARDRMGFDRIGIWFIGEKPDEIVGSFGIDESNKVRDERGNKTRFHNAEIEKKVRALGPSAVLQTEGTLFNHKGETVGKGSWVCAVLWSGKDKTGYIFADNLISQKPVNTQLLALYAATFGHLCSLKKTQDALRRSEERFRELWENAPVAYHTLNSEGVITAVNQTESRMLGYRPEEMVGRSIFDFILPGQRDEAEGRFRRKLSGETLPKSDSRIYVKKDGSEMNVSVDDRIEYAGGKVAGLRTTMVDVTALKKTESELKQSLERVHKILDGAVNALTMTSEMRDPYTAGHQRRVSQLACAIAEEMGISGEQIVCIRISGLLHDVGKISIPAEILSKPGQVSDYEFNILKTHSESGYQILKTIEFPWPIAKIVIQHHERIDGSGYPGGLAGSEILLEARILAVADTVEAMASHRPYRPAFKISKALEEISRGRGIVYDPEAVDACNRVFSKRKFQFDSLPSNKIFN